MGAATLCDGRCNPMQGRADGRDELRLVSSVIVCSAIVSSADGGKQVRLGVIRGNMACTCSTLNVACSSPPCFLFIISVTLGRYLLITPMLSTYHPVSYLSLHVTYVSPRVAYLHPRGGYQPHTCSEFMECHVGTEGLINR